ncbi:MAG: NAD-dependent epimerase/dehydratase family protein [Alphaproteobacteria bacterium]|nr:NAD-dependent epimerase/dehydratase family protein [Alphaproteobacteria bacterium]
MRVFLLGATGSIGSAVLQELLRRGHAVVALARSDASAARIAAAGARAIRGDIASPETWVAVLPPLDAAIHMACDFASAMGEIDRRLLDRLLPALAAQPDRVRFLYTGGCWLYGATGDRLASEDSPFDPLPAFAWMVPHLQRVLADTAIHGNVVHPAMVHDGHEGGVLRRFAVEAKAGRPARIVGNESVRWPLVHCDDLAELYALVLERAPPGESYLGVADEGVPVGRIARRFSDEVEIVSADEIARELGEWARGYGCDQRLSGAKARRELGWVPTRFY